MKKAILTLSLIFSTYYLTFKYMWIKIEVLTAFYSPFNIKNQKRLLVWTLNGGEEFYGR